MHDRMAPLAVRGRVPSERQALMSRRSTRPRERLIRDPGRIPTLVGAAAPLGLTATHTRIQRNVTEDLTAGRDALYAAESYGATVSSKIQPFTQQIEGLDSSGDLRFEGAANSMAAGFRVWADNYYNKAQAYLYEAELAARNTTTSRNPNQFAVLGVDTDENPDLDIISQFFDNRGSQNFPVWHPGREEKKAIEVKASTSDKVASMDSLARKGMQQLRKREVAGGYNQLSLELHNDNPGNHWPLTEHMFQTNFGSNFANVTQGDWNARLTTVMQQMKNTYGLNLPVTVNVVQGGQPYCRVAV